MEHIIQSPLGEGSFCQIMRLFNSGEQEIANSLELLKIAIAEGNNLQCDLLVADIYGESAKAINLPGEIIASCFGKPDHSFCSLEDKIKSMMIMHCLDICNVAGLLCTIHKIQNIIFLLPNLEGEGRGSSIESYLSTSIGFLWPESSQDQKLFIGAEEGNKN